MKLLPLSRNVSCMVDDDAPAELVSKKWSASGHTRGTRSYAYRTEQGKRVYMHRLLTNCPDGMVVDHINGDSLDNRMANLRCVTVAVNSQNRNEPVTAASGERYVLSHKRGYIVRIVRYGVRHYGGFHKDVPAAVVARDKLLAGLLAAARAQNPQIERRVAA